MLALDIALLSMALGLALWLKPWRLLAAVFVAFRPQWLATWSDRLYLER